MSTVGEALLITEAKSSEDTSRRGLYLDVCTPLPCRHEMLSVLGGNANGNQDESMHNHIIFAIDINCTTST